MKREKSSLNCFLFHPSSLPPSSLISKGVDSGFERMLA